MPDENGQAKLSGREQVELCALLAVGYNAQRCVDIFEEQYDITLTMQNVYQNYIKAPKWKKLIARRTREAERNVMKHPLAKKVNRLKVLQDAINEAFTWRLDKIHYDKDGTELSRVEKRNIGMIAQLIRETRIEIEGEKIIDQSQHKHFYVVGQLHNLSRDNGKKPEGDNGGISPKVDATRRLEIVE